MGVTTISESAASSAGILSERLAVLLDDILSGRAPNAGRFCGYCYHPLAPERLVCPHCGRDAEETLAVAAIPREVIEIYRLQRSREGLVVRTMAWVGLTLGVVVALLPIAFWDVTWWSASAFFALLLIFYLLSANLANSVGDALGYRWGQSLLRKRWQEFVAKRDR